MNPIFQSSGHADWRFLQGEATGWRTRTKKRAHQTKAIQVEWKTRLSTLVSSCTARSIKTLESLQWQSLWAADNVRHCSLNHCGKDERVRKSAACQGRGQAFAEEPYEDRTVTRNKISNKDSQQFQRSPYCGGTHPVSIVNRGVKMQDNAQEVKEGNSSFLFLWWHVTWAP